MAPSKRTLSAFVLVGAIVVPGVINYFLVRNGLETFGAIVWILGYGGGILVLWHLWLRPLDLSGPGELGRTDIEENKEHPSEPPTDRPQQGNNVANEER